MPWQTDGEWDIREVEPWSGSSGSARRPSRVPGSPVTRYRLSEIDEGFRDLRAAADIRGLIVYDDRDPVAGRKEPCAPTRTGC